MPDQTTATLLAAVQAELDATGLDIPGELALVVPAVLDTTAALLAPILSHPDLGAQAARIAAATFRGIAAALDLPEPEHDTLGGELWRIPADSPISD
ncbi:MAG TPA: hypothetical protein VM677_18740, partial [Actinokineospora sp.]|nr:hypothetical protein [Actinokineospora sp.]